MKICSCCGEMKPPTEFQIRRASTDGLTASCKCCLRVRDAARAMLPKRVEARKKYLKTDNGKAAHNRATSTYRHRNKEKRLAHTAVNNAMRRGHMKPQPCFVCGGASEAHHPDYSNPLGVVWLCPLHHKQAHAMVRRV